MPHLLRALAALAATLAVAIMGGPDGLPPEDVPWHLVGLEGGPTYAVAVSPTSGGGQTVAVAGHRAFLSQRGVGWHPISELDEEGTFVNLVAGPDGVFLGASAEGVGARTTNYGRTWRSAELNEDDPVWMLAASPNYGVDEQAYGITTVDWQLYRNDGGRDWRDVQYVPDVPHQTGALAFSPLHAHDEVLFAGTDRGVYKSTNQAQTWELVVAAGDDVPAFGPAGGTPAEQGLVVPFEYGDDPDRRADPDVRTLFAYNRDGLYRSDDEGQSWRTLPLDVERVHGLAVSPGFPDDPMLVAAVSAPGAIGAVSDDGGERWTLVSGRDGVVGTGVAMAHDFYPVWPDLDPDRWYIFLPSVLRGVPLQSTVRGPLEPDTGSREVYISTDGDGVWLSRDAGQTWQHSTGGLTGVRPTDVVMTPGGSDAVAFAASDAAGLFRSVDGGRRWRFLDSGLPRGADETVRRLAVSPSYAQDGTLFAAAQSGLWVSRDRGATWSPTDGPADAGTLALSPAFGQDGTILADDRISTDGGRTWDTLDVPTEVRAATFSPDFATDRTLWIGGDAPEDSYGLYRSEDAGASWTLVEADRDLRERNVRALDAFRAVGGEPIRLMVGTHRGLVASDDGGETFERVSGLTREVRDVESTVVSDPFQTAVLGTALEDGVQWSDSRGIEWTEEPRGSDVTDEARAVSVAGDGTVLLAVVPLGVARYGTGSVRVELPWVNRFVDPDAYPGP